MLAPHGVLAEVPAVVTPKDDDRIVGELEPVEFVQQLADQRVRVTHAGIVAANEVARHLITDRAPPRHAVVGAQLARVVYCAVGCVDWFLAIIGRQLDGVLRIQVPVFPRGIERQVRLEKTDREEERLLALGQVAHRHDRMLGQASVRVGVVGHVGVFVRGSPSGLGS